MAEVDAPFKTKRKEERSKLPIWLETVVLLVIAVGLAVLLKQTSVQAFYIPSGSMEPGLVINDRILVQKWSYWSGTPKRGDVVVFADPGNWLAGEEGAQKSNPIASALGAIGLYPAGGHLVKRVIGVGGDRIDCDPLASGGRLRVNGYSLVETGYLPPDTQPCASAFHVVVPSGQLWVMGDNRSNSADSRAHMGQPGGGFVPANDVVGKVFAVIFPLSHVTWIGRPATFEGVPKATP